MTRFLAHPARLGRLVALACALACALAGIATARAQTAAAPAAGQTGVPHNPFGTIVGVVIDSLHGKPLAGAQVSVEGLPTLALADSLGRFRIDSVRPGKYRIGVFHPLLDSLDLSIASPPLSVGADSVLVVKFGTPSAVTFLRLLCGAIQIDTMNGIGPSVVVGRVLDAETEAPVPNMHVTVSWTEIQAGAAIGLHRIQRTRDTTTGPTGEFRFCHLPSQLSGVARAASNTASSTGDSSSAVSRPLALNGRLVVALVLHVPGSAKPASGTHGTASSDNGSAVASSSVLTGRVMRADGASALSGAQVTVLGTRETTVTNDSGMFTLSGLPAGSRTLAVRAVGWIPVTMAVDLTEHTPRQVVVPLQTQTAVLQGVVVTARLHAGLQRVGFDTRQHSGAGHYLTPDEVEKRDAFEFVDILNGMPGVMRRPGPFGDDYLTGTRGGSGCVGYVVDGVPYVEMTHGDINTFVRPEEVGAIEVYQPGESPSQFAYSPPTVVMTVTRSSPGGGRSAGTMGTTGALGSNAAPPSGGGGGTGCVKILVWTKARLGLANQP